MMKFFPNRGWRDASSLVIAARNAVGTKNIESGESDYSILLMQRGSSASFAKSLHVFPGGVFENSDAVGGWVDNFSRMLGTENASTTLDMLRNTSCSNQALAPPTFTRNRAYDKDYVPLGLPAEVAFKICSLRETFEESGILLARPVNDTDFRSRLQDRFTEQPATPAMQLKLSASDQAHWSKEIRSDPSKFVEMCQSLDCVPDVWSIHLWSTWLTPSNAPSRFDTPFFVTVLPEKPELFVNDAEHQSATWLQPSDTKRAIREKDITVGPPQVMELSRFACFDTSEALLQHAARRAREYGSERWCPLRLQCTDGLISIFPGDSLYGNYQSGEALDCTMLELISRSRSVHALLCHSARDHRFYCSIPQRDGHKFPAMHDKCPEPHAGVQ